MTARRVCLKTCFIALCFCLPFLSALAARGGERKLPLLCGSFPSQKFPGYAQLLESVFSDLLVVQRTLTKYGVDGCLELVNSPEKISEIDWGRNKQSKYARLKLSSGFIESLSSSLPKDLSIADRQRLVIRRFAGAMALQMGRAVEAHYNGMHNADVETNTRIALPQLTDLMGDAYGQRLAREAGYGGTAVDEALEALGTPSRDVDAAATARHAHRNLRLTQANALSTLDRHNQGFAPEPSVERLLPHFTAFELAQKAARPRFEAASLDDLLKKFESWIASKYAVKNNPLEFNLRLLELQKYLAHPEKLSTAQLQKARELAVTLIAKETSYPFRTKQELIRQYGERAIPAFLTDAPDFRVATSTLSFYRDPDFLSALDTALRNGKFELNDDRLIGLVVNPYYEPAAIDRLAKFLPPEILREKFAPELKAELERAVVGAGEFQITSSLRVAVSDLIRPLPLPLRSLAHDLIEESISSRHLVPGSIDDAETARLLYYLESGKDTGWRLGTSYLPTVGSGAAEEWNRSATDPAWRNRLRRRYQKIWDRRGYFATIDILLPGQKIDWPEIWRALGVPPDQGSNQLRSAAKAFWQSRDFVALENTVRHLDGLRFILDKNTRMTDLPPLTHELQQIANGGLPDWADDSLRTYLRDSPNVSGINPPSQVRRVLREKFALKSGSRAAQEKLAALVPDLSSLKASWEVRQKVSRHNIADFARYIDKLNVSTEEKKAILLREFLSGNPWLLKSSADDRQAIQSILGKYGLSRNASDSLLAYQKAIQSRVPADSELVKKYSQYYTPLLDQITEDLDRSIIASASPSKQIPIFGLKLKDSEYLSGVLENSRALKAEFAADLNAAPTVDDKIRLAKERAKLFFEIPLSKASDRKRSKAVLFREWKKSFLEQIQNLPLTPADRQEIFLSLTAHGATPETDAFLFAHSKTEGAARADEFSKMIAQNRVQDPELKTAAFERAVQEDLASGHWREAYLGSGNSYFQKPEGLARRLAQYLPEASENRDATLERMAWKAKLTGVDLAALEEQKSTSLKLMTEGEAHQASVMAAVLDELSASRRLELLDYLAKEPPGHPLPENALLEIRSILRQSSLLQAFLTDEKAREAFEERIRARLELLQRSGTTAEKLPTVNLLLRSGHPSLLESQDFPLSLIHRYLYEKDSLKEKALASYLRRTPPSERSVTLAHLLSQNQKEKGSILATLEPFKTPGIKGAQQGALWQIFSDTVNRELAEAMDNAPALSKFEIEKILRDTLSREEFAQIATLDEVLGSAGIKTVVKATLIDGRKVAIGVQRPGATGQIRSSLLLLKNIIADLEADGVEMPKGLFQAILSKLDHAMQGELDFKAEAQHLRKAKPLYEEENTRLAKELKGYRFKVPQPDKAFAVYDNVLVMDFAPGIPIRRLPTQLTELGPAIVKSSVGLLFRKGAVHADPHPGNFLVDENSTTISVLDLAQSRWTDRGTALGNDERYLLAQLLHHTALTADPDEVLRFAKRMSSSTNISDEDGLRKKLTEALRVKDVPTRIKKVVNTLEEGGVHFDEKYLMGSFKELLTLSGSNYTTDFEKIVEDEARRYLTLRKGPQTLLDAAAASCQDFFSGLGSKGASQ